MRSIDLGRQQCPAAYAGHCNQLHRAKSIASVEFFANAGGAGKTVVDGNDSEPRSGVELFLLYSISRPVEGVGGHFLLGQVWAFPAHFQIFAAALLEELDDDRVVTGLQSN